MPKYLLLIVFLFLYSCHAWSDNNLSLTGHLLYFDYEEFSDNGLSLDKETGFIPGISFALNKDEHLLNFSLYDGTVDYDGHTNLGAVHKTDTDESLFIFGYRRSIPFILDTDKNHYYLQLNYQIWDRDIQPSNGVNGLFEQYTWWSLEAGINSNIYESGNLTVNLDAGVFHTVNGKIAVDLKASGYGEPSLDLGDKPGAQGKLSFQNKLSEQQTLHFNLNYKYWKFDKSNSKTLFNGFSTKTINEPKSQSSYIILSLGLTQYF